MELTQAEADRMRGVDKMRATDSPYEFPLPGEKLCIPLFSVDEREEFLLDLSRGSIKLTKATYQNRVHQTVILVRLDIDGPPHGNPDGEVIPCPHLHLYREDYADKWAIPAPAESFADLGDLELTLSNFFAFCNVSHAPIVNPALFR
jgi:hypothetical protein